MGKEGVPFSQIAERFALSLSRIKEICRKGQNRIDNFDKWPPLKKLLPARVQNALGRVFDAEDILRNPGKLASLGYGNFITWRSIGKKNAKSLADALESLGYTVSQGTTPNRENRTTDPGCQIFLDIGKAILSKYFDYSQKNTLDDREYIPVVRLIIEGIAEEMRSSGMLEPNCKEVAENLKDFNRQMYQNIWNEHAKEDHDPEDEEPFDPEKENDLAKYTFDYIYKHRKHPPNREF